MEDNLVVIQEPRGGQVSKRCSSIPPPQTIPMRMQPIVGAHEEGQPPEGAMIPHNATPHAWKVVKE